MTLEEIRSELKRRRDEVIDRRSFTHRDPPLSERLAILENHLLKAEQAVEACIDIEHRLY